MKNVREIKKEAYRRTKRHPVLRAEQEKRIDALAEVLCQTNLSSETILDLLTFGMRKTDSEILESIGLDDKPEVGEEDIAIGEKDREEIRVRERKDGDAITKMAKARMDRMNTLIEALKPFNLSESDLNNVCRSAQTNYTNEMIINAYNHGIDVAQLNYVDKTGLNDISTNCYTYSVVRDALKYSSDHFESIKEMAMLMDADDEQIILDAIKDASEVYLYDGLIAYIMILLYSKRNKGSVVRDKYRLMDILKASTGEIIDHGKCSDCEASTYEECENCEVAKYYNELEASIAERRFDATNNYDKAYSLFVDNYAKDPNDTLAKIMDIFKFLNIPDDIFDV